MPVEAVKVAVDALAWTVTEAGRTRAVTLSERVTTVPPEGAALERATVQVVLAFALKVVVVHWTDERATGAIKERAAVLETPVREAVMVAL